MQVNMQDVTFYFRKKTGIKMSDSGLTDVVLGREGLTVSFHFLFLVWNITYLSAVGHCISSLPIRIGPRSSRLRASLSRSTPLISPFATLNMTCCTKPQAISIALGSQLICYLFPSLIYYQSVFHAAFSIPALTIDLVIFCPIFSIPDPVVYATHVSFHTPSYIRPYSE